MRLKILDKLGYQTFPLTEDMIDLDITQEELNQIGITKCFDLETNEIVDYTPPSNEPSEVDVLRSRRETECFVIINRGTLWYETLTAEQKEELRVWYQAWLDITETMEVPVKPSWLDEPIIEPTAENTTTEQELEKPIAQIETNNLDENGEGN